MRRGGLIYRWRGRNAPEWKSIEQRVPITWTARHGASELASSVLGDEFDDVLKLGSGELGHHLIDTTLMTAAITVSDTLSAADQRTSGG